MGSGSPIRCYGVNCATHRRHVVDAKQRGRGAQLQQLGARAAHSHGVAEDKDCNSVDEEVVQQAHNDAVVERRQLNISTDKDETERVTPTVQ